MEVTEVGTKKVTEIKSGEAAQCTKSKGLIN